MKNLRKFNTSVEAREFIKKKESRIRKEYLDNDRTAREVAQLFLVFHNDPWSKALFRYFGKKQKGWGGSRKNSGNKKGVQFCKVCRKKLPCIKKCEI